MLDRQEMGDDEVTLKRTIVVITGVDYVLGYLRGNFVINTRE